MTASIQNSHLKKFPKLKWETDGLNPFLVKLHGWLETLLRRTPLHLLSCKFWETFCNSYFTERFRMTASGLNNTFS